MTNPRHTVLYVGVTNSIAVRVWEHVTKQDTNSFTARYNLSILVFYRGFGTIVEAIAFEKYVKGKSRLWKENLIFHMNPLWKDLTDDTKVL